MPTGDIHNVSGLCWCGINHEDDCYGKGFEAGRQSNPFKILPTIEQLAKASPEHYEEGAGYFAKGMTDIQKASHHALHCMVDGRNWYHRLKKVIEDGG